MATYDLNRLWLTVASKDALTALRQTDPDRASQAPLVISDFSAPLNRAARDRADIAEAA